MLALLIAASASCRSTPPEQASVTSAPLEAVSGEASGAESARRGHGDIARSILPGPPRGAPPAARGKASCATTRHPGGDWPALNHDLRNSRSQPAEQTIGVDESSALRPAWSFAAGDVGATGGMRSTPIVAHGCVYLAFGQGYLGDRGDVVALNADTGELVWHAQLDGSVLGLAAANGMIYATPSSGTRGDVVLPVVTEDYQPGGSYAVAFNARTGKVAWTSERLDDGNASNGTFVNASPLVFEAGNRSTLFVPLSGGSGDGARVPMYFLDARTGSTIRKAYALSPAEYEAGFGGTGIWATAAYDPTTQHLYAGTADSDGHTRQHPYNNALLKIDANPRRATFATIVAAFSGTTEHANLDSLIGYPRNPLCGLAANGAPLNLPTFFDTSAAPECLELDLDFGASPNLYADGTGRLKVGALQKSGLYHSVDAAAMTADWAFFVGPGGAAMDAGTAAVGDGDIFLRATPNLLFNLGQDRGALGWVALTELELFAYQPVTLANDVLYAINDTGFLLGFDARTGGPLLHRLIAADGGFDQCLGVGAGVAVARNTVYAPCDAGGLHDLAGLPGPPGGLVAYRS